MNGEAQTVAVMRGGLLALSALGIVGTMAELTMLRHWSSKTQLIPWAVLLVAGTVVAAVVVRPTASTVRLAAVAGAALAIAGGFGVFVHVIANMQTAPLDGVVGPTWDQLPIWRQIWLASTGGVGPAPPLAAATLAPTGVALVLTTYRHPASRPPSDHVEVPATEAIEPSGYSSPSSNHQ